MPFDIDVLLAQLLDPELRKALTHPDVMQAGSRELVRQMPGVGQLADMAGAFGQAPMPDDPNRANAQARIATMDRLKADVERSVAKKEKDEASRASEEAAAQDEWVRSVGYEPDQDLSDPEKGILVEEMPAEKLLALRKGAADREPGYTGGEGSFSQGTMTPEIAAREAELKQWLAGQDERSARYDLTPEQQRRNPEGAELASQRLTDLKREKQFDRRQASIDKIADSVAGEGGKIPFEKAQQLQMLGVPVPYGSMGTSTDEAIGFFDSIISEAGSAMSSVNPLQALSDPTVKDRMMFEQYSAMLAEGYKRRIAEGMNPDDAIAEIKHKLSQLALANGLVNSEDINQQAAQIQQQAQASQ